MTVEHYIRTIPDFPHAGIMFRDVTTLFADPTGWALTVKLLVDRFAGERINHVAGIEARGFMLAGALAGPMNAGVLAVRKAGKLPAATIGEDYSLEYGQARVEIHTDAAQTGDRVLVVDDLLATGGTAAATISLIERLGAEVVAAAFVVDLPDLGGRSRLEAAGHQVVALCEYAGE